MDIVSQFWSYLGFSDRTINEKQLLTLIYLLGYEHMSIKPADNLYGLMNQILFIYINAFETNSFKYLTEQQIIEALSEC